MHLTSKQAEKIEKQEAFIIEALGYKGAFIALTDAMSNKQKEDFYTWIIHEITLNEETEPGEPNQGE